MKEQNLQGAERWLKKKTLVLERTRSDTVRKLQYYFMLRAHRCLLASFKDIFQASSFTWKLILHKACIFSMMLIKASGTHLNTHYEDTNNWVTHHNTSNPSAQYMHIYTHTHIYICCKVCWQNLISYHQMALFWGKQQQKQIKKPFEMQQLWNSSSEKTGKWCFQLSI